MGLPEEEAGLERWSSAELLAGLNLCGTYCQHIQAAAEIPRHLLPVVLAARPFQDGRMVTVFHPGGQFGRSWRMPPCTGQTPGEGEALWLDAAQDAETGQWSIPLAGAAEVFLCPEMRVSLIEDALLDCGPGAEGWAVLCLLP
jgi:hypothetical protein